MCINGHNILLLHQKGNQLTCAQKTLEKGPHSTCQKKAETPHNPSSFQKKNGIFKSTVYIYKYFQGHKTFKIEVAQKLWKLKHSFCSDMKVPLHGDSSIVSMSMVTIFWARNRV